MQERAFVLGGVGRWDVGDGRSRWTRRDVGICLEGWKRGKKKAGSKKGNGEERV